MNVLAICSSNKKSLSEEEEVYVRLGTLIIFEMV